MSVPSQDLPRPVRPLLQFAVLSAKYGRATSTTLTFTSPIVVEFLAPLAILRWRMRPRSVGFDPACPRAGGEPSRRRLGWLAKVFCPLARGCAGSVPSPDRPDRLLLPETVRSRRAGAVSPIPPLALRGRSQAAAAGHLQVTLRVVLPHPLPGITKPFIAARFGILRITNRLLLHSERPA
jgi:hypothetical protein